MSNQADKITDADCGCCRKCLEDVEEHGLPILLQEMVVCVKCGNKRCPKAEDHSMACTNSNEPGQVGTPETNQAREYYDTWPDWKKGFTLTKHSAKEDEPLVVVRLRTSAWSDDRGLHVRRSLTYLKRKCQGFNFFEEDISNIGADEAVTGIINLDECKDGVYQIVICNEHRDWETGYVEDYEYKLIPYKE